MPRAWYTKQGTCFSKLASYIEFSYTTSEPTPGSLATKSPTFWRTGVAFEAHLQCKGCLRNVFMTLQGARNHLVARHSSVLCCSGRRSISFLIRWFDRPRPLTQPASRQLPWRSPRQMFSPSIRKRRTKVRRGHPLPVARLLRSRYEKLALTSWECRKADRGKTTLLSVRATLCGFQPQRPAALAGRSSGSTPASATMHGRSFLSATRPDLWSRAGSVVTFSTFVFYMHRRAHPSPRSEEWWNSTGSILRTVFRPTRDRVVTIDAN